MESDSNILYCLPKMQAPKKVYPCIIDFLGAHDELDTSLAAQALVDCSSSASCS